MNHGALGETTTRGSRKETKRENQLSGYFSGGSLSRLESSTVWISHETTRKEGRGKTGLHKQEKKMEKGKTPRKGRQRTIERETGDREPGPGNVNIVAN